MVGPPPMPAAASPAVTRKIVIHAAEGLGQIVAWLAEGKLVPPPVVTYPLADVARAHADIESGRTVGKLVLVP